MVFEFVFPGSWVLIPLCTGYLKNLWIQECRTKAKLKRRRFPNSARHSRAEKKALMTKNVDTMMFPLMMYIFIAYVKDWNKHATVNHPAFIALDCTP